MKRLVIIIPLILLVLLNACGSPGMPPAGDVGMYITYTPTTEPAAAYAYQSSFIFMNLNLALENMETSTKFAQLEHVTGASYQVVNVQFPVENNMATVFQVDTRCECARNAQCCSPTRTFVVTMMALSDAMNTHVDFTVWLQQNIPPTIRNMRVRIFDHATQTDTITIPWEDVKTFVLQPQYSGFELGARVTETVP